MSEPGGQLVWPGREGHRGRELGASATTVGGAGGVFRRTSSLADPLVTPRTMPSVSYFDARPNGDAGSANERGDDAAVSIEVQLHAGDLGKANR